MKILRLNSLALTSSAGVIALALLASDAAFAQDAAADQDAKDSSEIIVTATKRDETLQDVPIQISVVTSEALTERGITQAAQLLGTASNVTFIEDNAGEVYINIRGQTAVRASDPNVAIVIDGVTLSTTKSFNRNLFGIKQMEIVKGPQTALYGRNAAAGAIVITTKKPGDRFEGEVDGLVGRYGTVRASASVSGPLTENLGFTISGSTYHTDGPFRSESTEDKPFQTNNDSMRARLYYENGPLTLDLKGDYFIVKGKGISYNSQLAIGGETDPDQWYGHGLETNLDISRFGVFASNVLGITNNKFRGVSLNAEYDLGVATFGSITGFNKYDEYFGGDNIPYVPDTGQPGALTTQYVLADTNFSQEFRLTSNGDTALRWQVGVYYLNFKRNGASRVNLDTLGTLPRNPRDVLSCDPTDANYDPQCTVALGNPVYRTKDYAAYANAQYDILDSLTLSLAGRYDIEKRSIKELAPESFNACLAGHIPYSEVEDGSFTIDDCKANKTFKVFNPKATLAYHPTRSTNIYVSYGKGFKSGGFNPIGAREKQLAYAVANDIPTSTVYVQNTYAPEKSETFEAGAKFSALDGALNFSGAAFQTKVDGAQQFTYFPATALQTVISIDKVKLKGFDLSAEYTSPIKTNLSVSFGYVDGKVEAFAGNPATVGNVAPGSAEYTLSVAAMQPIPVNDTLTLVPRVEFNRYGATWWDVDNDPGTRRDPYSITNARLTLKSENGWQIGAWVDNAFNKKYWNEVVPLIPQVLVVQYRGWTRSFGMDAKYTF